MLMLGTMDDDEITIPEWTQEDENSGDIATITKDIYAHLHYDIHTKSPIGCKRAFDGDDDGPASKQAKERVAEKQRVENRRKRRDRIAKNREAWESISLPKWGREHIASLQEIRKKRGSKSVFKYQLVTYVYYAEDEHGQETLSHFYESIHDCKSFIVWDVGSDDLGKAEHWGRLIPGRSSPSIEDSRCKPIAPTGRLCIGVLTNQGQAPEQMILDHIMENRKRYGIEALMVFVTKGCDSFLQGTLQYRVYNDHLAERVCKEDVIEQAVTEDAVEHPHDTSGWSTGDCRVESDTRYTFPKNEPEFVSGWLGDQNTSVQTEGAGTECCHRNCVQSTDVDEVVDQVGNNLSTAHSVTAFGCVPPT